MTILFAAGNDGQNEGGDGYQTCGMEAQAKNVVTVGAGETTLDGADINNVAFYSSKGPAADGRIKPDIIGMNSNLYYYMKYIIYI